MHKHIRAFNDLHVDFYFQTCKVLSKMLPKYIEWPATDEQDQLAKGFNFPLTVGAIDGSHIEIKAPLQKLEAYTNRKSYTSVVLQAVCDSNMKFLDVSIGWAGSMHDARIFRLSALGKRLEAQGTQPYHLLGDSAYPLKSYLITPFRDNGHLSEEEKHFNTVHSSSRSVIERAFARLKGKFRRLKYLDMDNMSLVPVVITAACVLHNAILTHECITDNMDCESIACPLDSSISAVERRYQLLQLLP